MSGQQIKITGETKADMSILISRHTGITDPVLIFKLVEEISDTIEGQHEHKFGHYEGEEYEHCRVCGIRGDRAAKEKQ